MSLKNQVKIRSAVQLLFFLILVFFSPAHAVAAPQVTGIRFSADGDTARFVIDISENVDFSHMSLPDPYRIVIDLPEVDFSFDTAGTGTGQGLIERYRYGLFNATTSRLVLDLTAPVIVERAFVLPPQGANQYRLVFDLKRTSQSGFLETVRRPQQTVRRDRAPVREAGTARPQRDKRLIVIDAGHGGVDPGNLGIIGVPEKTIVLNIAKEMERVLEATGRYEVVLTRGRDVYIAHRERFEKARDLQADFFISVHADSISDRRVRGATVYTLNERASDAEAAQLARKENRSDLIAGIDLSGENDEVTSILVDLAQRETLNYSARFAEILVTKMRGQIELRTNPHRFASLMVLRAPDVPSILLETGYLTNREDANFINSSAGREALARAVRGALDDYFRDVGSGSF